jgi:hypothetical protein
MKKGPVKLFFKLFLLGIPLLICLGIILLYDPFKVIRKHPFGDYYKDQPYELNRDYVSTQMLLANHRQSPPEAFILGSSRSFTYHCAEWQKYIAGARCFHYPAASENLFGIYSKIKFIDRLGLKLRHVLIIADYGSFGVENRKDHLHILHPEETGNSWIDYQAEFIKASFSRFFIVKYIDYKLSGQIRPYMRDIFQINPDSVRIDPATNDYFFEEEERQLAEDSNRFYEERKALFPPRDVSQAREAKPAIAAEQYKRLSEIKAVFDRHQTDYKIIINPLYDQISLNRQDLATLEKIFGAGRVFDYSGANQITQEMVNYYDPGHYRPFIANTIMQEIYTRMNALPSQ